jgi:acetyl-CoA acetyltransferase
VTDVGAAYRPYRDRCAITGIGSTAFTKASGRTELSLATEAALAAISDAGLEPGDIDGLVRCDSDNVLHNDLALALGVRNLDYYGENGPGGVAPCGMIGQAVAAVLAGQATNVIVYRALNGRSGRRWGQADADAAQAVVGGNGTLDELVYPYGLFTPGQMWALIAQRHMIEFGTRSEHLGAIAVACRERANTNPAAMMYDRKLTLDDYLAARFITEPLRLFDFCLETDGACAVVVSSAERAKDSPHRPVLIRSVAQATGPGVSGGESLPILMRGPSLTTLMARTAADLLYARAGLGPSDIDVAQIYDCFTISVLTQLEDYGFCPKGEGGPFAASGEIGLGGSLPINTSGAHLSEGYIHGMSHIVEAVRQLRGDSTSPVPGAQTCLVTSSPIPNTSALILVAP